MHEPRYLYPSLKEVLNCLDSKVNIFGVVSQIDQSRKSRGSDWVCTMKVVDMSNHSPGLDVVIFARSPHELPSVRAIGDIIRFHRAIVQVHQQTIQVVVQMAYASFLLVSGDEHASCQPYQASSRHFTCESQDIGIIQLLRQWAKGSTFDLGNEYLMKLEDLQPDGFVDLCCLVVHVDKRPNQAAVIHVWDGTDVSAPPPMLHQEALDVGGEQAQQEQHQLQHQHPPHQQQQDEELSLVMSPLPIEKLRGVAPVGSIVAVLAGEKLPELPREGTWIRLRNVLGRVHAGTISSGSSCSSGSHGRGTHVVLTAHSRVSPLAFNTLQVLERIRASEARLASPDLWIRMGVEPSSLTVTSHEGKPFSTLREVLTHPQAPDFHRCLVRVVGVEPPEVEDFCDLAEKWEHVRQKTSSSHIFRIRLTLEDSTGRVQANLVENDAVLFFAGIKATDLRVETTFRDVLKKKMARLLGRSQHALELATCPPSPPWIKCCLLSYYLESALPMKSRYFRIICTTLCGD